MATSRTRRAELLGVRLGDRTSIPTIRDTETGRTSKEWLRISTPDAERLLRAVARLVADLPRDSNADVVWTLGADELLVHTGRLTFAVEPGLVVVGVPVECDQAELTTVLVPLAVGTTSQVRGLFASTLDAPSGPAVVTRIWSEALRAFAYECLVTLAQHVAAQAGKDRQGRPLVPAAFAAERGALLVKPMARNEA